MDERIDAHLKLEWEQAWIHYRHLEERRGQYLGFFFTVLIGSLTIAVALFGGPGLSDNPRMLLAAVLLVLVVFLTTITLFTSLVKDGWVMTRYQRIIGAIREHAGVVSTPELPFDLRDVERIPEYILRRRFGVHNSAQFLLAACSVALVATLIGLASLSVLAAETVPLFTKALAAATALYAALHTSLVVGPVIAHSVKQRGRASRPSA